MEADDIPPHLSANEHRLRATEEQLLKDGKQWLARAAQLYTQTSKIKIWVPVVCSLVLTSYYMYTVHARAGSIELPRAAPTPPPVAVAIREEAPVATTASTGLIDSAETASKTDGDGSDGDLLQRAQAAHSGQEFADEAKLLQQVFDHSRSAALVCPAIGKAYESANDLDAAIHAFEQCTTIAPENMDTLMAFARTLQTKADFKRAAALYRQVLQKTPSNLDAQTGLALIDLNENHLKEAQQRALAILQNTPGDTDALLITGIVAWRQAKLAEAKQIFFKGVELDNHRADFHAFLGRIAEAQGQPQEALQEYDRALVLDPKDGDIADRRERLKGPQ